MSSQPRNLAWHSISINSAPKSRNQRQVLKWFLSIASFIIAKAFLRWSVCSSKRRKEIRIERKKGRNRAEDEEGMKDKSGGINIRSPGGRISNRRYISRRGLVFRARAAAAGNRFFLRSARRCRAGLALEILEAMARVAWRARDRYTYTLARTRLIAIT